MAEAAEGPCFSSFFKSELVGGFGQPAHPAPSESPGVKSPHRKLRKKIRE